PNTIKKSLGPLNCPLRLWADWYRLSQTIPVDNHQRFLSSLQQGFAALSFAFVWVILSTSSRFLKTADNCPSALHNNV
ncbi:MAG TPA: hypothetical protein VN922_12865, partial [Bacteroidia bacterium]|nr:hypothetical protein [Bacteroidia bacterium]